MVPDSARSQIYTESDIGSIALPLPAWDMLNNEFNNGHIYGSGSLPTGLKPNNIIESQVSILEDANPSTGRPSFGQPLYRLNWRQSKPGGSSYNGPWNGGGQFHLKCSDSPVQCAINMARGPVNYNFDGTLKTKSWFADSRFSTANASRGFLKLDYLKTGVTPPAQVIKEFIIPIGPWNMTVNGSNSPNEKRVQFGTTLDITKIVSVTAVIYSDPDPGTGITNVDYFDRRGNIQNFFEATGRGGEYEYSSTSVILRLFYKPDGFGGSKTNAFNIDHSLANFNRGWVKITYVGTTPALNQPYAVKSKFKKLGGWLIQDSDDPDDSHVSMNLPFGEFGVAANRLTHIETTVHSDYINATEHTLTSLRRITNDVDRGSRSDNGLFAVEEAKGVVTMLARGDGRQAGAPITYFAYNHANAAPYNRGWFRMDYLAGSCAQGGAGLTLRAIPSSKTSNCAGTGNLVVEGAGRDVWDNNDEFTYVYKSYSDGGTNHTFKMKVESQGSSNDWAKTGLMVRTSADAGSSHVSMMVTPSAGVQFTKRTGLNQSTSHVNWTNNTVRAPIWLRIVKTGTNYTGSYSKDGTIWTELKNGTPTSLPSSQNYMVGVAASSRSPKMNKSTLSGLQF